MRFYLFAFISLTITSCQNTMNKTHAFRLKTGKDLKKEIESYVKSNNIQAGWIGCGVGSLTDYNIRFANQLEFSSL